MHTTSNRAKKSNVLPKTSNVRFFLAHFMQESRVRYVSHFFELIMFKWI